MNEELSLPSTRRSVILAKDAASQYSWQLVKDPIPTIGDREILVRVRAVSINSGDIETLEMLNDPSSDLFEVNAHERAGQIVGSDAAGDVVAVGKLVASVGVGDRVCILYWYDYLDGPMTAQKQQDGRGEFIAGVFADYVVVEETGVIPIPAGLNYAEASTLPMAGLTAWMGTCGGNFIRPGDDVVIQGTGGVATFALQFVVAAGGRPIVISSAADKLERAIALGAHHGINYKETPDWGARVLALTGGKGAEVVLELGGKSTIKQSLESLAYHGTVAIMGAFSGYDGAIPTQPLFAKVARAQGVYIGSRADFRRMSEFVERHDIHPVIAEIYPFEHYPAAVQHLKRANYTGKLVLDLSLNEAPAPMSQP